jgi:hypothetical protein
MAGRVLGPRIQAGIEALQGHMQTETPNVAQKASLPTRNKGQFEALSNFKSADGGVRTRPAIAAKPRELAGTPIQNRGFMHQPGMGSQIAGSMLQAGSHFMPPGPASMMMNAVGHGLTGAGNQIAQTAEQQHLMSGIDAQADMSMAMTNAASQAKMRMMANDTIASMAVDAFSNVKKLMEKG